MNEQEQEAKFNRQLAIASKKYKYIRAWGKFLQSSDYYIENEQVQALADNAPERAIYRDDSGWRIVDQIESEKVRNEIINAVKP